MQKTRIIKTTLYVSLIVLVGKLIGFARETIIAAYYGANGETDAFFLAHNMPGMIFPAICNSIATAFITLYSRKTRDDFENGEKYYSRILISTSIIGLLLGLFGAAISKILVPVFAPGFTESQQSLAIRLTEITMGAFVFNMIQCMICATLNVKKIFVSTQVSGLINNISVIILTVWLGKNNGMELLTIIVIVALVIQDVFLVIILLSKTKFYPNLISIVGDTKELIHYSLPIMLGNCAVQINTIVDKSISSTIGQGSLSALSYANTIVTLITGLFITALSTVVYPILSETKPETHEYKDLVESCLSGLSFVLIPISCILIIYSNNVVDILFRRGQFDEIAAKNTSCLLQYYSIMFPFVGFREIYTRVFFSSLDTKTPMINTFIGVGINIGLSIALSKIIGIGGIALGTSISSIIIAFLLHRSFQKKQRMVSNDGLVVGSIIKQFISIGISGCIIKLAHDHFGLHHSIVGLLSGSFLICAIYIGILLIIDRQNIKRAIKVFKRNN